MEKFVLINTFNAGMKVLQFNSVGKIIGIHNSEKVKTNTKILILAPSTSGKTYLCKHNPGIIDGDDILSDFYARQKFHFWEDEVENAKVNRGCAFIMDQWFKDNNGIVAANFYLAEKPTNYEVDIVLLPIEQLQLNAERRRREGNIKQPTDFKQIKGNYDEQKRIAAKLGLPVFASFDHFVDLAKTFCSIKLVLDGTMNDFVIFGKRFNFGKIEESDSMDTIFDKTSINMTVWLTTRDIFDSSWIPSGKAISKWLKRFNLIYQMLFAKLILIGGKDRSLKIEGRRLKYLADVTKETKGLVILPFHKTKGYKNLRCNELAYGSKAFRETINIINLNV